MRNRNKQLKCITWPKNRLYFPFSTENAKSFEPKYIWHFKQMQVCVHANVYVCEWCAVDVYSAYTYGCIVDISLDKESFVPSCKSLCSYGSKKNVAYSVALTTKNIENCFQNDRIAWQIFELNFFVSLIDQRACDHWQQLTKFFPHTSASVCRIVQLYWLLCYFRWLHQIHLNVCKTRRAQKTRHESSAIGR